MQSDKCPRCGAEPVEHKGWYCPDAEDSEWPSRVALKGRWACGSSLPYIGDFRQSDACTITHLQQQLADATRDRNKAYAACNAIEMGLQWNGDGYDWNPTHGDYRENPHNAIARCARLLMGEVDDIRNQLAKSKQQLADARLLARAVIKNVATVRMHKNPVAVVVVWVPSGKMYQGETCLNEDIFEVETRDGLPILTDELRTALKKAIGET